MISVRPASHGVKNLNDAIFSHMINMINVTPCIMVVLIELYPFTARSVILIVFQGHSSVKQFELKFYILHILS